MNLIRSLSIDGVATPISDLVVWEMHLSSGRSAMTEHRFELIVDSADMVVRFGSKYRNWLDELRQDDEEHGDPIDLAAFGYPDLDLVLADPTMLRVFVEWPVLKEFIGEFTGEGAPGKYWLHEITDGAVAGDLIRLSGSCYRKPLRV